MEKGGPDMENFRNYYIEQGQGPALILLHGNGEDSSYFEHQLREFRRDFRVIAVDTRGHGKSPRGTAPFRIRQFAEDLYGLMQHLQLEKASILGFSDGGNIALTFALKYPQLVDKLILNGANLCPEGVKDEVQLPIELEYRIALMCAEHSAKAQLEAEMLGLMVNDPHIAVEELAQLAVPTLVIAGDNDMIKDEHTRLIADSIPGAQLAIIHGDHFIANACPVPFNAAVREFLTR